MQLDDPNPLGALLEEPLEADKPPKMKGSALVMAADTEEEVREWLRNDIYSTGGAWNADKATIYPVSLSAFSLFLFYHVEPGL